MENIKLLLCLLASKGQGALLESEAVDVKTQNVLGAELARSLVEHVNIYTRYESTRFPLTFFSPPLSFLLLLSSLQILVAQTLLLERLPSVTLTDHASCCCRGTVCGEIRIV